MYDGQGMMFYSNVLPLSSVLLQQMSANCNTFSKTCILQDNYMCNVVYVIITLASKPILVTKTSSIYLSTINTNPILDECLNAYQNKTNESLLDFPHTPSCLR